MGGRKAYSSKKYIGSSKKSNESFKTLKDYIEKGDSKKVATTGIEVLASSKKLRSFFSYSTKLAPAIMKNYSKWSKETDINSLKREIVKEWALVKKKNEISIPKEVEVSIIENAVKSVWGGAKK